MALNFILMETPEWIRQENIKVTLDARPLLASGQHPLEKVIREADALQKGQIYEILTPFPPQPMIEKMEEMGFDTWSGRDATGLFHTYFKKN
jgi:uncharacterized protein (DUF2249 family)